MDEDFELWEAELLEEPEWEYVSVYKTWADWIKKNHHNGSS